MAREVLPSATTSAPAPRGAAYGSALRGLSLPRVQAVVGTLAGLVTVAGAASSLWEFVRPANTGALVAIVQAADSRRAIADATVEVLTSQNAIVATLTPDEGGRATQALKEGTYVVRVSHPSYAADVRRIHVLPRQTVEIRASLRAGSSSPFQHAVNNSVNAVRRALRF